MKTLTKEKPIQTSESTRKGDTLVKQVDKLVERDSRGRLLPGSTANPNGRPPAGEDICSKFRDNPKCISILEKIFKVANTLGDEKPHRDALQAAKLVVERLVPVLKSSDLQLNTDGDQGFVFMPTEESPERE